MMSFSSPSIGKVLLLSSAMLLASCASTSITTGSHPKTASAGDIASGNYAQVNVCRVKSIKRSAEAPELRVDNIVVGQLGSGGKISVNVKAGLVADLFLEANPFMYRFDDFVLRSKDFARGDSAYWVIVPEANVLSGITVFLGGAVAESSRQKSLGQFGNWTVSDVSQQDFEKLCNQD
jgi:hypothetical protein